MKLLNHKTATEEEKRTAVDIGRPNPLQNPFPMQSGYSRKEAVALFKEYFINKLLAGDKVITEAFIDLRKDDSLICYCAPQACHGDVIIEVFNLFDSFWNHEEAFKAIREKYQADITIHEETTGQPVIVEIFNNLLLEEPHAYLKPEEERLKAYKKHLLKQIASRDAKFENGFRYLSTSPVAQENIKRFLSMANAIAKKTDILLNFFQEWRSFGSYSEYAEHIRKEHHELNFRFMPESEGMDHINLYSKSKTELGRLGSNFAFTPFEHPQYGRFNSVEGFWYWLSTGMTEDILRGVRGYEAKQQGLLIRKKQKESNATTKGLTNIAFKQEIKKALLCKVEQNERFAALLKSSVLPLTHYYVYGKWPEQVVNYPEAYSWIHEYISDLRDYLNGKADKVLIAGSRGITDFDLIEKFYSESEFKAIEFISGKAPGVDTLTIDLAKKLETPCEIFKADWDGLGKRAGFVRNAEMGEYCTAGLLVWDGVSPGTKGMLENLQRSGTKHLLFTVF